MTATTQPRISDSTLTLWGRILAGGSVLAALLSVGIVIVVKPDFVTAGGIGHLGLWAVGMGSLAWLTIGRQPRNAEVWALAAAGFFAAGITVATATVALTMPDEIRSLPYEDLITLAPADLPVITALAMNWYIWGWAPAFFTVLTLGLQWFPDGHPPSPRWRILTVATLVAMAVAGPASAWTYRPSGTVPYNASDDASATAIVIVVFMLVAASIASLVFRYRHSSGVVRHQIRWIAFAGAFFGATMLLLVVEEETTLLELPESVILVLLAVAEILVIAAFWIAITRYRLYDIDLVISRTVTYGALALFITAVYVAIVVGLGDLLGQGDDPNPVLAIGATAAVALLFEPARRRFQRWANQLVYGKRATPYEVLAKFSTRTATESDDEVLERIPRLIVDGTGATKATLWTLEDDELRPAAWWPRDDEAPAPLLNTDGRWSDPGADYSVPVEHRGELLGGLSLDIGRGEALAPAEEELVHNLAGGLGLAMRNARLTGDLRNQVAALAESRERILTAADEARRDLERDLDMGPQQELVAVKVKLGVVRSRAEQVDAAQTAGVLAQLEDEVGTAIGSVRDFARGVYPPLLEADGLSAAISAEGDKAAIPVSIETDSIGRYPRDVETAVFFTALEALQNAAKYSDPNTVTIRLVDDGASLSFEVRDDGRGFDPGTVDEGSGLPGMRDRVDAAGGTLSVESTPGAGTTIAGSVPLDQSSA